MVARAMFVMRTAWIVAFVAFATACASSSVQADNAAISRDVVAYEAHTPVAARKRASADVVFLRGGFDVFSNGINDMARTLGRRGVPVQLVGYKSWRSVARKIVARQKRSGRRPVVLVGHSFGANSALRIAAHLRRAGIRVDYLATFAATAPPPVPANVRRATNYYQSLGWGEPLRAGPGFRGRLKNLDFSRDLKVTHFNIEKQPRLQQQVIANVLRLVRRGRRS